MLLRHPFVWLVATAALGALASPARACSFLGCIGSAILPESGSVPANHLELLWSRPQDPVFPRADTPVGEIHLYQLDGARRVELETRQTLVGSLVHIVPTRAVPEGTELLVTRVDPCSFSASVGEKTYENRFRVGPQAPAPGALGQLTAQYGTGDFPLWVRSGECKRIYRTAFAELSLALSEAAQPYADTLRYSLQVDGQPYASSEFYGFILPDVQPSLRNSGLAPGKARMHTLCEGDFRENGALELAPGPHRVRMIGELNDGTQIESDEITVELQCPPSSAPDPVADAGSASSEGGDLPSPGEGSQSDRGGTPDHAQDTASMMDDGDEATAAAASTSTLDDPPSAESQPQAPRASRDAAATCALGRRRGGEGALLCSAIGVLAFQFVRRRIRRARS